MTHATIPPDDGGPRPRPIWDLLNEPRAIDPWTIRICCLVLAVAFGSIALLRAVSTGDFGFVLPRLAMMAYAAVGAVGGPHFSWRTLRAYTVGLTLMLPLTASYVIGTSGYQPTDIPFCTLATATPFLFLLAGWDFVTANVLLAAGHATLFAAFPTPATPHWTLWGVQLGAMACGTAAGLLLASARARAEESDRWWKASHARERTVREFAETACAAITSPDALRVLADAFAATAEGATCTIILATGSGGWRIAAASGPHAGTPGPTPEPPHAIRASLRAIGDQVRTAAELPPGELATLVRWCAAPTAHPTGTMLPFGGIVPGAIVLHFEGERTIDSEEVRTWTTMAHACAVAIANVEAWTRLRAQEADARRVSEERIALADMRTRFVTQASHEFRTPLAVILSAAGSLERYAERLTTDERTAKCRRIGASVHHMTNLLDDVLTLGRAEEATRRCRREPIELGRLCASVLAEIRETAAASHRLALHCAEPDVVLAADPTLVRVLVSNLLSNAVKYSPDGGAIDLTVETHADDVVLRIRDQGIGIPEEDRARLFESFSRAANVHAIPGSGLGLTIVQRAVEAHGGSIRVESAVGVGTTIEVTLPKDAPPGAAADAPRRAECA